MSSKRNAGVARRASDRNGPADGNAKQQDPDLLLLAGVLSSIVYITADIVCGLRYPGYSFTDQVISELSAIGAPTAVLWVKLLQVFAVLFAAFTIGVIRESCGNQRLRLAGWLLVAFVLSCPLWSFVPMHQRGDAFTWTDIGHIALGGVMVLLVTTVMAVGAGARRNGAVRHFRAGLRSSPSSAEADSDHRRHPGSTISTRTRVVRARRSDRPPTSKKVTRRRPC